MVNEHDPQPDEIGDESIESQLFRDANLNGDERLNKLVKMIDTRFESQARRTNKLRKETREGFAELNRKLAPVIAIASAWPYITGVFGIIGTAAVVVLGMGILP